MSGVAVAVAAVVEDFQEEEIKTKMNSHKHCTRRLPVATTVRSDLYQMLQEAASVANWGPIVDPFV